MKVKVNVKFDEKKAKAAIIKEAEKVAAQRDNMLNMQPKSKPQKIKIIVCKNCRATLPLSFVGTTCPRCKKPLF